MPSVDVEQVIRNLPLSSGEVPIHCIKNAEDPIFFIGQLLKADGSHGVHYSTALKNDLCLVQNALSRDKENQKKQREAAAWKLWEQLKIDKVKAEQIISRCDARGIAFADPFHILFKDESGKYTLIKKADFPTQSYF